MVRSILVFAALVCLAAAQPAPLAAQTPSGSRAASKPAVTSAVNINTASASELQALPGIGAKTAARIVEYRQKNGPFKKIEEILESSRSCR